MKTFKIGEGRSLSLDTKNNKITIRDKGTKKAAEFTPERWAAFLSYRNQIDYQLDRLTAGVAYCMHYGGAWHVSLTKGFRCIDLRKFYVPFGQTLWKPTKEGIALRLSEWPTFKEAVDKLHHDNPPITNFTPCIFNRDHATPELVAACPECTAYRSTTA